MHHRRIVLVLVLAVVAATLLLPAAASAMTYHQAVDYLYATNYPQNVETYLNSLGTSPLGFRLGRHAADDTAARYLETSSATPATQRAPRAGARRRVGRARRHVTVGDRVFTCSQFAGVPAHAAGGVTAPVVYVGSGSAADFDAAGDVTGKLVLVDSAMDNCGGSTCRAPRPQLGAAPWCGVI